MIIKKTIFPNWLLDSKQFSKIPGFSGDSDKKNPPAREEDVGSIPGPRRSHLPWSNRLGTTTTEPGLWSQATRTTVGHML